MSKETTGLPPVIQISRNVWAEQYDGTSVIDAISDEEPVKQMNRKERRAEKARKRKSKEPPHDPN